MELFHKIVGNKTAQETIIFLHEGLGCVEMWKNYPEQLCVQLGLKGIVFDRSGYGKSPGSLKNRDNRYLHEAADELERFIQELNIVDPILYGHSDGGSIALIHAASYGRVKAIITEAAHVFNEPETIQGVKEARPLLAEGKMDGLRKYHGERFQEVFYAWNDIWLDKSFVDWNITDLLPNIKIPLLVIQGSDDQYGTLKQVETTKNLTKGKTLSFTPENCGHAPFKEQTELVQSCAIQFIQSIK